MCMTSSERESDFLFRLTFMVFDINFVYSARDAILVYCPKGRVADFSCRMAAISATRSKA